MKALGLRFLAIAALVFGTAADSTVSRSSAEPGSPPLPVRDWRLHDGKGWQIVSASFENPEVTDEREGNRGACPPGMVDIRGRMKVDPTPDYLDAMQSLMCSRWLSEGFPERCAEYDAARWAAFIAKIPERDMSYCIDRYEYPDVAGQYPWVFVTFNEADELCSQAGKRLCSEEEWTFACKGEDDRPYPYGFARSSEACVIDRPWRGYDEEEFSDRTSRTAMLELDRVWQGEVSGARPNCKSTFGVHDLTGNVDEWTRSTRPKGYPSVLKGGYWGQVRDRCGASTRAHGENFAFYQQGFRCCADQR